MKERNSAISASCVILLKDGKVLLTRRANSGYCNGYYQFPSGHVEAGELPIAAAIREAKEEVGIDIAREDLDFVHMVYAAKIDQSGERMYFFFVTSTWGGEISNMEPECCDDVHWFDVNNLPEKMVPQCRTALEAMGRGVFYTELTADWLLAQGHVKEVKQ